MALTDLLKQLEKASGELEAKKDALAKASAAASKASQDYEKAVDGARELKATLSAAMDDLIPTSGRVR